MQSAIPSQLGLTHRSGSLQESLAGKALLVIGATVFVAACAHISLPLPFTPVPLTLQNFADIWARYPLGAREGELRRGAGAARYRRPAGHRLLPRHVAG